MRIGVGGGGRLLRGGVSTGRGGVRGGVGVGPFSISGGSRSSSNSDEWGELLGPIFLAGIVVVTVILAVFLFVFGPFLVVLYGISIYAAIAVVFNFGRLCHPYRDRRSVTKTLLAMVALHVFVTFLLHISNSYLGGWAKEVKADGQDPWEFDGIGNKFFANSGYWSWWNNVTNWLLSTLTIAERYLLVPSIICLVVFAIVRERLLRTRPATAEESQRWMDFFNRRSQSLSHVTKAPKLTSFTKAERKDFRNRLSNSLSLASGTWQEALGLRPNDRVTPRAANKYVSRFSGDLHVALSREISDISSMAMAMETKDYSALSNLQPYWLSRLIPTTDTSTQASRKSPKKNLDS